MSRFNTLKSNLSGLTGSIYIGQPVVRKNFSYNLIIAGTHGKIIEISDTMLTVRWHEDILQRAQKYKLKEAYSYLEFKT